jgi:hypothetical protein
MADIFVSYAHEDREWVSLFTERLRQVGGWDIWWDRTLLPGEAFDEVIQKALSEARRTIVVWSVHSVESRWVRAEAGDAAHRDVLIPVRIDDVVPPLQFRTFETANLSAWHGEPDHHDFLEIVAVLRAALAEPEGQLAAPSVHAVSVPEVSRFRRGPRPTYLWVAGVAGILFLVTTLSLVLNRPSGRSTATVEERPSRTTPLATVPQLTYGTWTLHQAIDDEGRDWSNSVVKFHSQEPSANGLTLKGTFTWRLDNQLIGSEEFNGHYFTATRQLILEGQSVVDASQDHQRRLAVASYSAILSPDERSLLDGRWGSTSTAPGVLGRWEARR